MRSTLRFTPWTAAILVLITSCSHRRACDPDHRAQASASIDNWNRSNPGQPVAIVNWESLRSRAKVDTARTLVMVMASYCEGVDSCMKELPEVELSPESIWWISNDDFEDIQKFLDRVKHTGFNGRLGILDNDHYGCYLDQRERNKGLLQEACGVSCGDVIYRSGALFLLLDGSGQVQRTSNTAKGVMKVK